MMLRLIIILMCVAAAPALAADSQPRITTTLDPADGVVVVGQPVRLHVRVLFPDDMARPPLVNMPDAPGAQIMRFESQALTVRDQVDGQPYVGKDFTFVAYPRRPGAISLPAPRITLLDRSGAAVGEAHGAPTRLKVSVPPGIDASGPVLVSDQVSAQQEWSPDDGLKPIVAGGAIVRVIHRQAADTPAMAMADFSFTAPPGVRAYPDAPVSEDRLNRGDVEGRRTDRVTYVFEKPGRYALPALVQPWWSPESREAKSLTLPGLEVTVMAAASVPETGAHPLVTQRRLLALGGLVIIVLAAGLLGPRLLAFWRSWRARRQDTAEWARRAAVHAARSGDAAASWRGLNLWLQRLPPHEAARLRSAPPLAPDTADLERALFRSGEAWNRAAGADLAKAIRTTRSPGHDGDRGGGATPGAIAALPPLNP